jgi:hypothetical protein
VPRFPPDQGLNGMVTLQLTTPFCRAKQTAFSAPRYAAGSTMRTEGVFHIETSDSSVLHCLALARAQRGIVLTWFLLLTLSFSRAMLCFAEDQNNESPGFVTELPAKESDVLQVVKDTAEDSTIRGTYDYEREKTLTGAMPAKTSNAFGAWQGPGEVFYKVLPGALAPRHFVDSADIGTITVRYVVQPVSEARTRVRIDAVFVETARRRRHPSDGTVETVELKVIQDKVQGILLEEQKAAEESKRREAEDTAKASALRERQEEAARLEAAESSIQGSEQRLHDLRHELELRVRDPNTALKSAPFQKAANLQLLGADAKVVILITTPYWYGVETPDGHRGWLRHDQVEHLP